MNLLLCIIFVKDNLLLIIIVTILIVDEYDLVLTFHTNLIIKMVLQYQLRAVLCDLLTKNAQQQKAKTFLYMQANK